jgi:predicted transcriptional regulator
MGVTSVRLLPEIETPLNELSKRLDRSKNYLINQAIREFIERQQRDAQRWRETVQAIDSVNANGVVKEQDVEQWLKSWGSEAERAPPKP